MTTLRRSAVFVWRSLTLLLAFYALLGSTAPVMAQKDVHGATEQSAVQDPNAPRFIRAGADPWVIAHNGKYYWSQSNNPTREIWLWQSDSLDEPGQKKTIWRAPRTGAYSRELWAPEIHFLDGRFYVFFAADDGRNENHLTYVLVSENDDPYSNYQLCGPLYTGDDLEGKTNNRWAIDSTVLERQGQRYLIWSGWEDERDIQYLYIAKLELDPVRLTTPRVRICNNCDYLWERVEETKETRGLNEGPEILYAPNGRVFLSYSCGASWLPTYKVALLELVGDDPMQSASWRKLPEPFLQSDARQFGVGHGCFLRDNDAQMRYIYHAKVERSPGWKREVFTRFVDFDAEGLPHIR